MAEVESSQKCGLCDLLDLPYIKPPYAVCQDYFPNTLKRAGHETTSLVVYGVNCHSHSRGRA